MLCDLLSGRLKSGKLIYLFCLSVKFVQKTKNGFVEDRKAKTGSYFGQGFKHEQSVLEQRMGYCEQVGLKSLSAVEKNVNIDGSVAVVFVEALVSTSQFSFDVLCCFQNGEKRQ